MRAAQLPTSEPRVAATTRVVVPFGRLSIGEVPSFRLATFRLPAPGVPLSPPEPLPVARRPFATASRPRPLALPPAMGGLRRPRRPSRGGRVPRPSPVKPEEAKVPNPLTASGAPTCAHQVETERLETRAGGPGRLRPKEDAASSTHAPPIATPTSSAPLEVAALAMRRWTGVRSVGVERPRQRKRKRGATRRDITNGPVPQGVATRPTLRVGP